MVDTFERRPIEEIIGWERLNMGWSHPDSTAVHDCATVDDLIGWLRSQPHPNIVIHGCESSPSLTTFPDDWSSVSGYFKDTEYSWAAHGPTMLDALREAVWSIDNDGYEESASTVLARYEGASCGR